MSTEAPHGYVTVRGVLLPRRYAAERSVQSQHLTPEGREKPNPVPMEPPVGYIKQPTIAETMRQMIRSASLEAAYAGAETEEEANDFDVDDEFDPTSPWEDEFEPDPVQEAMLALASKPPVAASPPPEGGTMPPSPLPSESQAKPSSSLA